MACAVFNYHVFTNLNHLRAIHKLEFPDECYFAGVVLSDFEHLLILFFRHIPRFPSFRARYCGFLNAVSPNKA